MANVCLILEGTYPYVSGGVSACVHQLVSLLPQMTFSIVYIGASSDEFLTPKYTLPSNVIAIQEVFLFDELAQKKQRDHDLSLEETQALEFLHRELHAKFSERKAHQLSKWSHSLQTLFPYRQSHDCQLFSSLASRGIWRLLLDEYSRLSSSVPFVDFFYTWRSSHLPIYRILSHTFPVASVYHAMCTGYAGLAAVRAAIQNKAPLVVTEHGIYAHERAIDIAEVDWLSAAGSRAVEWEDPSDKLKAWWIDMFQNMSSVTYSFASRVVTLYEGNRQRQLLDGARRENSILIPNGIGQKFRGLRRRSSSWSVSSGGPFRMGFVGRVVPIKDVKMLIKAVCTVYGHFTNISCEIIGPTDENKDYFAQCRDLISTLGLSRVIHFVGKKNVLDVYPNLDCVLLSSISEAQPLVVLEANSAGIPVVSTRVGSCQELLEGADDTDRLMGPSGLLSPIGDSEAFASQILKLIQGGELWEKMSLAGMERVSTFYNETDLATKYGHLYHEVLSDSHKALKGRGTWLG